MSLWAFTITCKIVTPIKPLILQPSQVTATIGKDSLKKDSEAKEIDENDENKEIVFYLIRHAPSKTNISTSKNIVLRKIKRLHRGLKEDVGLHDIAIKYINKFKVYLKNSSPDAIFCSCISRAQKTAYLLFQEYDIPIYVTPYLRENLGGLGSNFPPRNAYRIKFWDRNYSIKRQQKKVSFKLDYTYVEDKKNKNFFTKEAIESDINKFFDFFINNLGKFIDIHSNKKSFSAYVVTHNRVMKKFCRSRGLDVKINNLGVIKIVLTYNTKTKKVSYTKPIKIFGGYDLSRFK